MTESVLSDVFDITYMDNITKIETTLTVRSNKEATTVTVEDITTETTQFDQNVQSLSPSIVHISSN